jgi:predicted transposase YdaD
MSTTPYDDAFKKLADRDPAALLLLLGALSPGETAKIELLPRELRTGKQIADQLYLVTTSAGTRIVHIEAQTRWDPEMPERVLDYELIGWICYDRRYPIESFVLLLTADRLPADPPTSLKVEAGSLQVVSTFHLVKLWEVSAAEILALGRDQLLPFVPLMRGGMDELLRSTEQLGQIADEQERGALILNLLVLGGLRYNADTLIEILRRKEMYGIPIEQLRESSGYQYLFKDALEKGREEGREEGQREAAARLFQHLAAKRFPDLDVSEVLAKINDSYALEQLCLDLDQFSSEASLLQKLSELAVKV